jgi:hypothetical protein
MSSICIAGPLTRLWVWFEDRLGLGQEGLVTIGEARRRLTRAQSWSDPKAEGLWRTF